MSDQETTGGPVMDGHVDTPETASSQGEFDAAVEQIFADQAAERDNAAPDDAQLGGVESESAAPPDSTPMPEAPSEAETEDDGQPAPGSADHQTTEGEGTEVEEGETTPEPEPTLTYEGETYTGDKLASMVQVHKWATSLPAETIQGIDAYLSGQYELVPRGAAQDGASPGTESSGVPSPTPEDDEYVDPQVAELRAKLAALEGTVQATQQTSDQLAYQQEMARVQASIEAGKAVVADRFSLTDEELQILETATAQAQIIPAIAAKHGTNHEAALIEAMEMVYNNTPLFRERELQRRLDEQAAQSAALEEKRRKAASISGSSAPVPRESKPISSMSKEESHYSMVAELKAAMEGDPL